MKTCHHTIAFIMQDAARQEKWLHCKREIFISAGKKNKFISSQKLKKCVLDDECLQNSYSFFGEYLKILMFSCEADGDKQLTAECKQSISQRAVCGWSLSCERAERCGSAGRDEQLKVTSWTSKEYTWSINIAGLSCTWRGWAAAMALTQTGNSFKHVFPRQ